ncbi:coiled-coil domain-containing protein [Tenacibaculum jejuense]|uniref:Probable lipoprotein n=1 Tax=Tenacibaculum jejuense TaxID=584609 RepID=A0A238UFI2_9FLAO|nr:hypothetical protein [Tenacibaculum jejuense]SNR17214.1 Probable lipoprotein precursor [Tenacibaculum jejuense]
MKNFRKLALGGLVLASIGFTSCVDDEISEEVKVIYQNQAAFLAAQTSLIQAEADLEAAKVAHQLLLNEAQEAQNALAILNAENALELAKEEHLKALLQLKLEVQATKSQEAEKYLGKYLVEMGTVISLESDLEGQKRDLAALKATVIDGVFDKDEAIELKNIDIAALENQLTKDQEKLAQLKAVLSEPTSIGAQVIAIQKQIDDLKAENKERNARITEIRTTELAEFGDNVADYQQAKLDVEAEKKTIQTNETALENANTDLSDAQDELNDLTGGVTITFNQAVINRANAEKLKDEKEEAYNEIATLAADYSALINEIATVSASITQNKETIETIENDLAVLEADYNAKKAIFDANPSGKTVSDVGPDDKAGNHNDNSAVTYRLVLNANSNPISYGNPAYFSAADLPPGAIITPTPTSGRYFNIEADDTVESNEVAFNRAQSAFVNAQVALSNAKSELSEKEAELVELKEKQDTFDTTITTQVENAKSERDAAVKAFDLANDVVMQLELITTIENSILDLRKNLEEAKQNLKTAENELTRLAALVDDTKLNEYTALLDTIDALGLEVNLNQKVIADLQGDIAYFEGLELELEASAYSGSDYEERMEKIEDEIKAQETAVLELQKDIAKAKNDLEDIKQDKVNLEEKRVADIAELEALIEKTEAEIEQRKELAESFKKLMEEALAS